MQKSRLITIFAIVFVDLLGFSLILPLVPFYAGAYGASAVVAGLLIASYAAAQFIGAPLLGRLSDRYGRRPVLLVSILGTALGFLLLAGAEPLGQFLSNFGPAALMGQNRIILTLLFISRIVDGLTGGNISVAQAYIADVTDEQHRARGMGLIGAAFGLGFIFGPVIGGTLSLWGYAVPAFAAAGLATLNLSAVFMWLPESLTAARRAAVSGKARPIFDISTLREALQHPRVSPLLYTRFFYGLAFATLETIFPLYAQYHLALDERMTSYILAYVGLLIVLVQGLAIHRLTVRYQENQLIMVGLLLLAPSLLGWALAPNVLVLLIVLAPLALAGGILNTSLNSALSKAVYAEEVGGMMGLSTSLESLTRVLAPALGGYLLYRLGASAPGIFGAVLLLGWLPFVWLRLIAHPIPPLPDRKQDTAFPDLVEL